jgi:multifunctional 2-oxoglutarate metabolism enzyme
MSGIDRESFGPNEWLVDEMYRRYREDPEAVGAAWREFFEDYAPDREQAGPTPAQAREARTVREQPAEAEQEHVPEEEAEIPEGASPLRGIAARIAENMERSLGVPTATSVRTIPAKLLEENRRIINRYLAGKRGGKVSFTHLIGWAVVKALEARPAMKTTYVDVSGEPYALQHKEVNLGLAVDVERSGSRILIVPNVKSADKLDFAGFFSAYEEVIRKVRANELSPDDFVGTNVTLTNPGTVGTTQSVPRLLPEQGVIVGTGAITYPPEFEAADPKLVARLGVSKLLTITSTYDHRVIQGAESGQFLGVVHDLLLGGERFYDEIFASLMIPYEPVRWASDRALEDDIDTYLEKQSRVIQLVNMHRVRGHLLAELNPIGWEILSHPELDLSQYGLTVWDLDREFLTDGLPGPRKQTLRQIVDMLRDAYCRTVGVEYMHISEPAQKRWIQRRVEPGPEFLPLDEKKHLLDRLNAAEAFENFLHAKYTGHRRYSLEGSESLIPMLDTLMQEAADSGMIECVMGMAHRGRLNVLANIVGRPLGQIFKEFEGDIDPDTVQGSGDVKYHLGMTGRFTSAKDRANTISIGSVIQQVIEVLQEETRDPELLQRVGVRLSGLIADATAQENFNKPLNAVVRQWTTVTLFARDIPANPGGKKVVCEVGDGWGWWLGLVGGGVWACGGAVLSLCVGGGGGGGGVGVGGGVVKTRAGGPPPTAQKTGVLKMVIPSG